MTEKEYLKICYEDCCVKRTKKNTTSRLKKRRLYKHKNFDLSKYLPNNIKKSKPVIIKL